MQRGATEGLTPARVGDKCRATGDMSKEVERKVCGACLVHHESCRCSFFASASAPSFFASASAPSFFASGRCSFFASASAPSHSLPSDSLRSHTLAASCTRAEVGDEISETALFDIERACFRVRHLFAIRQRIRQHLLAAYVSIREHT